MGWRFRKSLKILPGIRLNFGKLGFSSASIGKGLFTTNIGKKGVRHTIDVPGTTGLSYRTGQQSIGGGSGSPAAGGLLAAVLTLIGIGCGLLILGAICCEMGSRGTVSNRAANTSSPRSFVATPVPTTTPTSTKKKKSADGSPASSSTYTTGPRGGCFYYSGSGRKVYVDHSYCR